MSEQDTEEGSGGWEVPVSPDFDGLESELTRGAFTWKRVSSGAIVYLDGTENDDVWKVAARNGFTTQKVRPVKGPHDAEVRLEEKTTSRNTEDSIEHRNRVDQ